MGVGRARPVLRVWKVIAPPGQGSVSVYGAGVWARGARVPEMPSSAHWWAPCPPSALRAPQCLHGKEPSPATVLGSPRAGTLGVRTAWD